MNKDIYLVTGGAGFIGSHIVDALVKRGQKVRVLDNFSAGRMANLQESITKIELIRGDIRDLKTIRKAVRGVKYVIHQAALRSVPKSLDQPVEFNEVNVTGTMNLLMASRSARVKRFIFASSSSVYGENQHLPQKESGVPQPISPYAATKLMGEIYCRIFSQNYKLETVALRYFNVFGPRQSLESQYAVVVPKFITCLLKNQRPPVHGDGKQSRDFSYVDDVVSANLLSLRAPAQSCGRVYNIACRKRYRVLDLLRCLNKLMGKNIKPIFTPPRLGDVRHTMADISQARQYLNYQPRISFREGLQRTIKWFLP
ncbi:MAG: SDR family oxidoreductase [Planctomycetota bacterium]